MPQPTTGDISNEGDYSPSRYQREYDKRQAERQRSIRPRRTANATSTGSIASRILSFRGKDCGKADITQHFELINSECLGSIIKEDEMKEVVKHFGDLGIYSAMDAMARKQDIDDFVGVGPDGVGHFMTDISEAAWSLRKRVVSDVHEGKGISLPPDGGAGRRSGSRKKKFHIG
jgi:hypothetical protein